MAEKKGWLPPAASLSLATDEHFVGEHIVSPEALQQHREVGSITRKKGREGGRGGGRDRRDEGTETE